jgi:hypothetical protein
MGEVTGVKEREVLANEYDVATEKFDLAMFFF